VISSIIPKRRGANRTRPRPIPGTEHFGWCRVVKAWKQHSGKTAYEKVIVECITCGKRFRNSWARYCSGSMPCLKCGGGQGRGTKLTIPEIQQRLPAGMRWKLVRELDQEERRRRGHREFLVECSCGTKRRKFLGELIGKTRTNLSCGCYKSEFQSNRCRTHGMTRSKVYYRHRAALNAGRLVPEWHRFEDFLAAMGDIPFPGAVLVRDDGTKPFGPGNARWGTKSETPIHGQKLFTRDGVTKNVRAWCDHFGIRRDTWDHRVSKGEMTWPQVFDLAERGEIKPAIPRKRAKAMEESEVEKIVKQYRPLALARGSMRWAAGGLPAGVTKEDCEAFALEGLWHAARSYKTGRKHQPAFATWAIPIIKQRIDRALIHLRPRGFKGREAQQRAREEGRDIRIVSANKVVDGEEVNAWDRGVGATADFTLSLESSEYVEHLLLKVSDEKTRSIIRRCVVEGEMAKEVAQEMGMSYSLLLYYKTRGLEQLREMIA
jgi:RNA polymerase sigma factor (sigma-70 family)